MKKAINSSEVARLAGVSIATVSYVMNDRTDKAISAETRDRVLKIAKELGYRPNRTARSLRTGRTNTIALWLPNTYDPYFANVIHNVQDKVAAAGYRLMIQDTVPRGGLESHLDWLCQWPVDGILALDCAVTVDAAIAMQISKPIVGMGIFQMQTSDFVRLDLSQGASDAVRHLISMGCKRMVFMGDQWACSAGEPRVDSYNSIVKQAGMSPEYIICEDRTRVAAYNATIEYVGKHGIPDGIFCYNDLIAIGAHSALRSMDLLIPEDVALVGHDGIEDTEYLQPRLSTVVVPIDLMCSLALQLLQRRIEDSEAAPHHAVFQPQLVVRASSNRSKQPVPEDSVLVRTPRR